ncbi:hypothetical protein D9615_006585 [Tricholomella constricta]|uniref:Reverse transcriptase domain-containing protein n=1 Tax=Tricholomella constricta TaxID=117010 RepID=A0A8H5H9D5_9AGAR|nr:hypothetical protein D9615_006585 [Tricholomella constricta]
MASEVSGPTFELDAAYSPPPLMGAAADEGYQQELSVLPPQAHLSKGVELIVRGLDRTSPYSAVQHLQRLLDDLGKRSKLPNLSVVQPMRDAAPTHCLDYAVVTFHGEYRANPRPDYMSAVGEMIRGLGEGISVGWNIAPGYDKLRTAWFRDDHGIGIGELKRGLEAILKQNHYDFQVCTANTATSPPRVTFQFIKKDHIDRLMRQPPVIKGHSVVPRTPRYVEPLYALEVAVVGVASYNDPQMIIDRYLQAKYGQMAQTKLIRSSRLVLDEVVYCVVLETPEITARFVQEPFAAFEGLDVQPSKPEYLYILNQRGFPTQWQRASGSSPSTDLHVQTQLDSFRTQQTSFQDTLTTLANRQQDMFQDFLGAQREMGTMFGNMISNVSYQSQLSSAQAELTSLKLTYTATHMMARLSNSDDFAVEMRGYADGVRQELTASEQRVAVARQNLAALQIQSGPQLLPAATLVQEAGVPSRTFDDSHGGSGVDGQTSPAPGHPQSSQGQPVGPLTPPGLAPPPTRRSPGASSPQGQSGQTPVTAATSSKPKRKSNVKHPMQAGGPESDPKRARVLADRRESMDVDDDDGPRSQVCFYTASLPFPLHLLLGLRRAVNLGVEIFQLFLGWGPPLYHYSFSCLSQNSYPLTCLLSSLCLFCTCITRCFLFLLHSRPLCVLLFLSFLLLFPPVLAVTPHHSPSPSNFRMFAANINGFANPIKISAVRGAILREAPHIFVLGETKSSAPVSGEFSVPDYQLLDAPGVSTGARHRGKWGLLVGVRRSTLTILRTFTPPHLVGRVLVCDVLLPDSYGHVIQHRVIALYAPWDPGGSDFDSPALFWNAISELCREAPFGFSLIGDFNAVSCAEESSSSLPSSPSILNQPIYAQFLYHSNAFDAWSIRPDRSWQRDWTFKSFSGTFGHRAILDRLAVSHVGVLTSYVHTLTDFIPGTDHRPILGHVVLVPRENPRRPLVPPPVPATEYNPRCHYPRKSERFRLADFAQSVDQRLHVAFSENGPARLQDDDDFSHLYHAFNQIILDAADQHFQRPQQPSRLATQISNPTIRLVLRGVHQINRLISALKRGVPWAADQWARSIMDAYYAQHEEYRSAFSADHLLHYLRHLRRQLHQCRFHEEKQEAQSRSDRRHFQRVQTLLHGGSAKVFFPASLSPLPLALSSAADDSLEHLVTGPQRIRDTTVQYFQRLYQRTARPPQPKPWTETPSIHRIACEVDRDPFQWPRALTVSDLRQLLKSGNRRPAPGPDGWEKWWLASLSDTGLGPVLRLLNYILTHSRVPECIKPVTLSTIHKRGPNTNLSNYRGITCSNLLANLPFAWLNKKLLPYLTRHGIVPASQVATQPGVQHRDLLSLLAQIQAWAKREQVPLYALQRDQKKGFDMLEPAGFYDALDAYHLPPSISLLDASSQEEVPYRVKTAYGLTDVFVVDGVTKQGGSLSPLKCTITTSLLSHWLSDISRHMGQSLALSSHQSRIGRPHVPSDSAVIPISMVEAMDDSIIWDTDWPRLLHKARLADRFQTSYGWETAWRKSAVYVFNADFDPPNQEFVKVPSVSPADPSSHDTTWNDVPVFRDHIRFLKVPVNRPDLQYMHLRDIINTFHLPYTRRPLPFTALSRIISQRLISKLRPCLQLQPIHPSDALKLDHLVASKVHQYLGFPFRFSTGLFTQPVYARGFGFPSLALINEVACISGLRRDLCHPVELFRVVAAVTLNDWTCSLNACLSPVQHPLPPPSSAKYLPKMPASWIFANNSLYKNQIRLYPTDLSFLLSPDLSIEHYANLLDTTPSFSPPHPSPTISRLLLSRMYRRGFHTLRHLGFVSLSPDYHTPVFHVVTPPTVHSASPTSSLSRDWHNLLSWFTATFPYISTLSPASPDLLLPPSLRRATAEHLLLSLPSAPPHMTQHHLPDRVYGSDASLIPPSPPTILPINFSQPPSSLTLSVIGPSSGLLASLVSPRYIATTSHAEVAGCLSATLFAKHNHGGTVYTDYLPVVNWLAASSPSAPSAFHRWLRDILRDERGEVNIVHVKAHTASQSLPARLNRAADHAASRCHSLYNPPPAFPTPTFLLQPYCIFIPERGFFEGSIAHYLQRQQAEAFSTSNAVWSSRLTSPLLYDPTPPPSYLYQRSPYAYAAIIQLYARSGQLDSGDLLASRFDVGYLPWCRFGCDAIESPHHLFVNCFHFANLRHSSMFDLLAVIETTVNAVPLPTRRSIIDLTASLFSDSTSWPMGQTRFYLGFLPCISHLPLSTTLRSRITNTWHTASIHLAGRIWAKTRQKAFDLFRPSRPSPPTYRIPEVLQSLFHL